MNTLSCVLVRVVHWPRLERERVWLLVYQEWLHHPRMFLDVLVGDVSLFRRLPISRGRFGNASETASATFPVWNGKGGCLPGDGPPSRGRFRNAPGLWKCRFRPLLLDALGAWFSNASPKPRGPCVHVQTRKV